MTTTNDTTCPARQALDKAAADLRNACSEILRAERAMTAKKVELRLLYIKAREDRDAMFSAFHAFALLGSELQRLKFEVESYDTEHERALRERNQAGDELDRAARVQGTDRMHSTEELARAAVRFTAAQQVLDQLQSKEAVAKRRKDAVELRQAESAIQELERLYRQKDDTQKASRESAQLADSQWNVLRNDWLKAMQVEDACKKALRLASIVYTASVIRE